jgi:hypothetical protein
VIREEETVVGKLWAFAGVLVLSTGCVPRYDGNLRTPGDADYRAAASFAYPRKKDPERISLVSDEWNKGDASCSIVRAAMIREADGISSKNAALGSLFAGATAALAAASGLYTSIKREDADPTVSALLAFGAGGTAVPTFFYFGSDDREKLVRTRIAAIDERRKQVLEAWASFKATDREFITVDRERDAALKRFQAAGDCAVPDKKAACDIAQSKLDDANARRAEVVGRWHASTDAVDDAVNALGTTCR